MCRRCPDYAFILGLTPGFNGLGIANCKTRSETFKLRDLMGLILTLTRSGLLCCSAKWYPNRNCKIKGLQGRFSVWPNQSILSFHEIGQPSTNISAQGRGGVAINSVLRDLTPTQNAKEFYARSVKGRSSVRLLIWIADSVERAKYWCSYIQIWVIFFRPQAINWFLWPASMSED